MASETLQIVVISDIHVHPFSAFASGTGLNNDRLQRTLDVLRRSIKEAAERDGILLIGGDMVETIGKTKNEVLNTTIETLRCFPDVDKYIVTGDHDSRGQGQSKVVAEESVVRAIARAVPSLTHLEREVVELRDGGPTLYGVGAQPRDDLYEFREADIGLTHSIIDGADLPSGYSLESDITADLLLDHFNLAVVGDIHHPQVIKRDGKMVLIPGSPEHHNFGDEGPRGWWVIDLENRDDGWYPTGGEMIESESPKFLTVEDPEEVKDDGNFYRIKGGTVDEDEAPPNAKVVGSPPTTVEQRDVIDEGSSREDILRSYVEQSDEKPVSDSELVGRGLDLLEDTGLSQIKDARLESVTAKNFLSYERFDYEVENGVTLVVGESRDFESNGAGKSSLFEAIYWALFGKTTKDVSAADVIRWDAETREVPDGRRCTVKLQLNVAGDDVRVIRTRTKSSPDLEVHINGEPIRGASVRETTSELQDYLGITPEIYKALAYYSQEDVLLFSRATDGERKELLSDLCGLTAYEEAASNAREGSNSLEKEIESKKIELSTIEEDLQDGWEELESAHEDAEEWKQEHRREIDQVRDRLHGLRDVRGPQVAEYVERMEEIVDRAESLKEQWERIRAAEVDDIADSLVESAEQEAREDIKSLREEMGRLPDRGEAEELVEETDEDSLLEDLEGARDRKENHSDEEAGLEPKISELKFSVDRLRSERDDFDSLGDSEGRCPRCNQEVDPEHVEELKAEIQEDIEEKTEKLKSLREKRDEAASLKEQAQEDVQEYEDRYREYEAAEGVLEKYRAREERIEKVKSRLGRRREEAQQRAEKEAGRRHRDDVSRIEDLVEKARSFVEDQKEDYELRLDKLEDRISLLQSKENPHSGRVDSLESRVEKLQDRKSEVEETLDGLFSDKKVLDFWGHGFSKQGVQSLLLDEVAAEFNEVRTEILPLITHGVYDVQLSTQSETASGGVREKTEFIVREKGEQVPYDNLSGGQRRRVDLGVMLTLAVSNSRTRGTSGILGLMILDEVFGFLDNDGSEALYGTLQEVAKTIPSIYVITQDSEMQSYFPQVLRVEQDEDGVSHITN